MDRKEEIIEILKKEGTNTAKRLADYFNVSLMTIYRDLKELEEEGRIIRKHGYIKLNDKKEGEEGRCSFCGKQTDSRIEVTIYTSKGERYKACCAHCHFMILKNNKIEDIDIVMLQDFITGNPINFYSAWFVVGSSANPCCQPSAIAFGSKEDAERFSKGFGGKVGDFKTAYETTIRLMKAGQKVELEI